MKFSEEFQLKHYNYDELDVDTLFQILKLRSDVFVMEQQCIYPDPDENDLQALHLTIEEDEKVVAYCRLVQSDEAWHLGRIITKSTLRNKGLGQRIVDDAIEYCLKSRSDKPIIMSAQVYLTDYYAKLGFKVQGKMYLEDGIPHIKSVYQEGKMNLVE